MSGDATLPAASPLWPSPRARRPCAVPCIAMLQPSHQSSATVIKFQALVFFLTWCSYASSNLIRKPLSVSKASMGAELHLSISQLGLLDTASLLPYAVFQIYAGALGDKYGARLVLAAGLTLCSLSTMAIGTMTSLSSIIAVLVLCGIGQALCWPACAKALSPWFSNETRNTVFGLWGTCQAAGGLLGTVFASHLLESAGWRSSFFLPSVLVMAIACANYMLLLTPSEVGLRAPNATAALAQMKEEFDHRNKAALAALSRSNARNSTNARLRSSAAAAGKAGFCGGSDVTLDVEMLEMTPISSNHNNNSHGKLNKGPIFHYDADHSNIDNNDSINGDENYGNDASHHGYGDETDADVTESETRGLVPLTLTPSRKATAANNSNNNVVLAVGTETIGIARRRSITKANSHDSNEYGYVHEDDYDDFDVSSTSSSSSSSGATAAAVLVNAVSTGNERPRPRSAGHIGSSVSAQNKGFLSRTNTLTNTNCSHNLSINHNTSGKLGLDIAGANGPISANNLLSGHHNSHASSPVANTNGNTVTASTSAMTGNATCEAVVAGAANVTLLDALRIPTMPHVTLCFLVLKLSRYVFILWLPMYFASLGYTVRIAGFLATAFEIGNALGTALNGLVINRYFGGRKVRMVAVTTAMLVFWLVVFIAVTSSGRVSLFSAYCSALVIFAAGVCESGFVISGPIAAELGEYGGRNAQAALAGIINGLGGLGAVVQGPLVGTYKTAMITKR